MIRTFEVEQSYSALSVNQHFIFLASSKVR